MIRSISVRNILTEQANELRTQARERIAQAEAIESELLDDGTSTPSTTTEVHNPPILGVRPMPERRAQPRTVVTTPAPQTSPERKRRHLTNAQRKKLSVAAKKRWALVRKAG